MKLEWRKKRNSQFVGYNAAGFYDFFAVVPDTEFRFYIEAIIEDVDGRGECVGYRLDKLNCGAWGSLNRVEVMGTFEKAIKAKKYAESLLEKKGA